MEGSEVEVEVADEQSPDSPERPPRLDQTLFGPKIFDASATAGLSSKPPSTSEVQARRKAAGATNLKHSTANLADEDPLTSEGGLRIYVYEMPARFTEDVVESSTIQYRSGPVQQCRKVFYGNEIDLHEQLLESSWRTTDPDEADLFYVPVYTGCMIKVGARTKIPPVDQSFKPGFAPDVEHISSVLGEALSFIRRLPFWERKGGEDHIWAFTQGFGPQLFGDALWGEVRRSIFLTNNGQYSETRFTPGKDVVMPGRFTRVPVFLERTYDEAKQPERPTRVYWGGSVMDDLRYSRGARHELELMDRNNALPSGVKVDVSRGRWADIFTPARSAVFCLCLEGWWAWTPRPVEVVLEGCIPVIVTDDLELPFEGLLSYEDFSIKVSPTRSMRSILDMLIAYPEAEVRRLQRGLRQVWADFYYPAPAGHAVRNILSMVARSSKRLVRHSTGRSTVSRAWAAEWNVPGSASGDVFHPRSLAGVHTDAVNRAVAASMLETVSEHRTDLRYLGSQSSSQYILDRLATCEAWKMRVRRPVAATPARKADGDKESVAARTHCWHEPGARGMWNTCPSSDFGISSKAANHASIITVDMDVYTLSLLVSRNWCRPARGTPTACPVQDQPTPYSISLAIQSDFSRMKHVQRLVRTYRGPVSWAVLVSEESELQQLDRELAGMDAQERAWLHVHTVQHVGHSDMHPLAVYPINALRAVAQQLASTEHVLVVDADNLLSATHDELVPKLNAAAKAARSASTSPRSNLGGASNVASLVDQCDELVAFVLPSFEPEEDAMTVDQAADLLARVKAMGIKSAVNRGVVWPMHEYYPPAYGAVDYARWMGASEAYEVAYSARFEPYLVVPRAAPLPDSRFVDRGGNYAQWVYTLWGVGYRMWVLPDVFVMDVPTGAAAQRSPSPASGRLWLEMEARLERDFGIPKVKTRGSRYDNLKKALTTALAKLHGPNAKQKAVSTLQLRMQQVLHWADERGDSEISGKFTLLTMTYRRDRLMRQMVRHYCTMPQLALVVVLSNNVERDPYPQSWFDCPVPIRMVIASRNSMNNRFDETQTGPIPTKAVMLMDDDMIFSHEAVRLAFATWQNSPQQHVGFLSRFLHKESDGRWRYGREDAVKKCNCFNMVLVGASFFHRSWLSRYSISSSRVRKLVDDEFNCDDIAFSFLVGSISRLPPIWVKAKYTRTSGSSGLFQRSNHMSKREECGSKIAHWTQGQLVLSRIVATHVQPRLLNPPKLPRIEGPEDVQPEDIKKKRADGEDEVDGNGDGAQASDHDGHAQPELHWWDTLLWGSYSPAPDSAPGARTTASNGSLGANSDRGAHRVRSTLFTLVCVIALIAAAVAFGKKYGSVRDVRYVLLTLRSRLLSTFRSRPDRHRSVV